MWAVLGSMDGSASNGKWKQSCDEECSKMQVNMLSLEDSSSFQDSGWQMTKGSYPISTSILSAFYPPGIKTSFVWSTIILSVKTFFGFQAWPNLVFGWTSLSLEAIGLMCWIWLQDVMLGMRFQAPSKGICRQLGYAKLAGWVFANYWVLCWEFVVLTTNPDQPTPRRWWHILV